MRRLQIQTRAWRSASALDIPTRTRIPITDADIRIRTDITGHRFTSARHFIGIAVIAFTTIVRITGIITGVGTKLRDEGNFLTPAGKKSPGFYFFGELDEVAAEGDVAGDDDS